MAREVMIPLTAEEEAEYDRQAAEIFRMALNPDKARKEAAEMVNFGYANDIIRGYTLLAGKAIGLGRGQLLTLVKSLYGIFDTVGAEEAAAAWARF